MVMGEKKDCHFHFGYVGNYWNRRNSTSLVIVDSYLSTSSSLEMEMEALENQTLPLYKNLSRGWYINGTTSMLSHMTLLIILLLTGVLWQSCGNKSVWRISVAQGYNQNRSHVCHPPGDPIACTIFINVYMRLVT